MPAILVPYPHAAPTTRPPTHAGWSARARRSSSRDAELTPSGSPARPARCSATRAAWRWRAPRRPIARPDAARRRGAREVLLKSGEGASDDPGMRRQDGFTLIELLVVVLILGMPRRPRDPVLHRPAPRANDAEAQQTAPNLRKALESYRTETDDYSGATVAILVARTLARRGAGRGAAHRHGDRRSSTSASAPARRAPTFSFERTAGLTTRTCDQPGKGGRRKTAAPRRRHVGRRLSLRPG